MPPLTHFFAIILFLFASFHYHCNSHKYRPEYEEDRDFTGFIDAKYFKDGSCAVMKKEENGYKWVPPTQTSYGTLDLSTFKCLEDFYEYAKVPECGDPWFDLKKYCAQVHFYKNMEISDSHIKQEKNKDLVLVLLDGCLICSKPLTYVKLQLSYLWPEGSFFTKCAQETKVVGNKVEIGKKGVEDDELPMSFTYPAMFYQRRCQGLFSHDDMPETYEEIKLEVKHDCGGGESTFTVQLPSIITKELHATSNVAEIKSLQLDLDKSKSIEKEFSWIHK